MIEKEKLDIIEHYLAYREKPFMIDSNILNKAVEWAQAEDLIRAVILVGSHAENSSTDELSDYDLSIFCTDSAPFLQNQQWLENLFPVWVYIPEHFTFMRETIPTRLVIFKGGFKVDFGFYPMEILKIMANNKLPNEFNMGYKVLVDKDKLTSKIPPPDYEGFKEKQPKEREFHDLIKEFWFEVYHVAKYLWRQDLWSVQFRLNGIHQRILLKMICWNEAAKYEWNYTTHRIGKRLRDWISNDTFEDLHSVFPRFDVNEGWDALKTTIALFQKLSHETAAILDYSDLTDLENNMGGFVAQYEIKKGPRDVSTK